MNRLSRAYTSLSNVLIVLAIVCAPLVARATTVATPVISLATGTYAGAQTVTITDSTSGSKIYYTTDGSTPSASSTLYAGGITVASSETLQAMATATGDTNSTVAKAVYTISGVLQVYLSAPGIQSTSVAGAATETFDALTANTKYTTAYVSTAGIGTYTGSSTVPFAIEPAGEFGGATDSMHTAGTNYFAVGGDSGSTSPVYLTLTNPVSYFGFWWSAGDQYNTVALYSGSTLYGTFTTANLLTFLNKGTGTITASNGATYNTSAYFGNPNITGTNDSTEPFAYISFVISGATINKIAFYNTSTSTSFESDNHSAIFTGSTVTIPTTFVPVETMSLGTPTVSVSVSPASANVKAGGTQQFTATVVGSTNTSVTWSISPATGAGTISSSGLYTAPTTVTTPQTVTITATSAANTTVKAPVIVNLLATPTVSVWPTASGITYGQTLASSTLTGGTTSTPGTSAWTTPTTAPGVGTASQSVTFTPTTSTSYSTVTGTVSVTVSKATPTVSAWPTASAITYGQTLASSTLTGGTASVAGTFAWTAPSTAPGAGTPSESVTFTPTASANYTTVVGSVSDTVAKATPTVSAWPKASAITYGQTLASSILTGGTASVAGTFAWTTPGTSPGVGTASQSVTFTPTASTNYNTVAGTVSVTVGQGTPVITFTSANTVVYGTTLTVAATSTLGTPSFTEANGTGSATLSGSTLTPTGIGTVTITASIAGTTNYKAASLQQTVTITQGTPVITFTSANTVVYGTTLTVAATSTLGTPTFTEANGTGSATLSGSTLTPTGFGTVTITASVAGTTNYKAATATQPVTITQGTPVITFTSANTVVYGTTLTVAATSTLGTPTFTEANGTGSATLSGSTLTPTSVGTVTITASVAGTTNYKAASLQQKVTITPAPSFTLTAAPSTLSIIQGWSGTSLITVVPANGFTGSVTLAASGLPSGVIAYFIPNPTTGASTLTLTASSTATTGLTTVTVTGTSGSLAASTTIALTVNAPPSFTLTATPVALSIVQGSTGTDTVQVVPANGFTGSVTLSASGLPSGVTASFAPNPTSTGSSVLTLTASSTATVGSATVTITGTSGGWWATRTIPLTITAPPPSFTLTATPATLSIVQGSTGTDTVQVVPANGFTGSVTLSASGLPSGVTASFAPNPTSTGSSVLTLTASSTATVGPATITITGISDGSWATMTIPLTITAPPPSFTLTASPGSLTVVQGSSGTSTIAVVGANGFTNSVSLTASNLPSGVTAAFVPNSTTGTSVLTLTASSTATVGLATVTVTGTSGSLTASTAVALTVSAPPSFTLTASPATLSIIQGSIGTDTITVVPANGFTGSVTLVASGLPSGVTAAFATNPTTGSSLLTLTASDTTTVGTVTVTVTGTSGSLTASTTVALTVTAPQCVASGYSYQRAIVIDHTKVPNTDQVNFPFLFKTIDPALATVSNNGHVASPVGNDIIFSTDPNGVTKLDHELEQYDPVHGQVVAWVRIPTLSHTADTVIYMFYGNSSIAGSEQNPTGVWDSNFGGVWHLGGNGPLPSTTDSTANGNNGTVVGSVTETSGEIGNGTALSGGSNYIDAGNNPSVWPTHTGTFSVWVNYNAFTYWTAPMGNNDSASNTNGALFWNRTSGQIDFDIDGAGSYDRAVGSILATGQWYFLTGSWDGSNVDLYVNGALVGSAPQTTDANPQYPLNLGIDGALSGNGDNFEGSLEEARVSGIARSADWVATEYSNQSSPGEFYSLSQEIVENVGLITPSAVNLFASQTEQFTALGLGTCNSVAINWEISPSNGSISATGLYSTPATISSQQTVTVTATNQANNSVSAKVTLLPPSSGPAGTVVTIDGAGFGSAEGTSSVMVGGLPAVSLLWSNTQIQAQIPTGTGIGTQNVVVTVGGQTVVNTAFNVTSGLTGIASSPAGTSASVTIDNPGQTAPLIFNATAGQVVSVLLSNSTFTGDCTPAWISILDPNGLTISRLGICNGQVMAPVTLPKAGIYTLVIAPFNNGATGGANITLWVFNELTGTITPGIPQAVTISIPWQEDLLTFSGAIGQKASVLLSNSTFSGACNPAGLSILDPNGLRLLYQGVCNGNVMGPFTLPAAGIYTLVIAPFDNDATGGATVSLTLTGFQSNVMVAADLVPTQSSLGSPVVVDLSLTTKNSGAPTGTVSCSGGGVTSPQVAVNPNGTASVPMNGLPLGKDAIVCSYTSNNLVAFSNSASAPMLELVIPIPATGSVSVTPATATLYAGQTLQFSASVYNTSNQAVTWSMPSGAPGTFGTLAANGLYTAPNSIATQQTVAITATGQASGTSSATAIVTLLPAPLNSTLTLAATTEAPSVTGASESFVATLKDRSGTPIAGEVVTFTVVGANSNAGSAATNASGVATYTYTGANSGKDTIQASANPGGSQIISSPVLVTWIVPAQPISTTSVVGQFFFNDDLDGNFAFNTPLGTTPVFTEEFPTINFNPPSGAIPGNSTVGVGTRPFTDVTVDENGNFSGTIPAQGNGYQPGVVPGTMGGFQAAFTGSYVVAGAGDAVISVFVDNTFVLGIGGGATQVSGPLNPGQTTTAFEQLPVMGASSPGNSIGGYSMTVHFPGPGTYPYELDYVECCGDGGGDTLSLMMMAGMPNSSGYAGGLPPAGSLTLTPNSIQPLSAGGQQAFTVYAVDASGVGAPNVSVGLVVSGVDSLQLSGTTDSTGHATILYQNVNPGTASVQAVALISGMLAYSNTVSVPWTLAQGGTTSTGGSGTLTIGITGDSSVTLPNTLQLTGTAVDTALPVGSNPTISWSQSGGPGTVSFSPGTSQASVTATFSTPGSYKIELTASDNVPNIGSAQFPVTVNPVPPTPQGWVGSPLYGSAVSGLVPITLAPGVAIQTGGTPAPTLTFYPASNPNNVTPIPITAGSGQIGTLDTTTLVNGTYWIELQATDTTGDEQYSLVMVTVSGNYKPGRVTATVTDLIVPATGLAINIQRNYDSLTAATSSDFGYGWSLGINVNLTVDPAGNVTFTLGGQRKTFYLTPQAPSLGILGFFPWYWPAYTPEPGLHGTLTDAGLGCPALDMLIPDGNLWFCQTGGQYNPPSYVYTDPNGTSYTISAAGNLQSIQDLSGNGLTITANGITSTTGLSVPFVRDSNHNNRITKITDPAGNAYLYAYDANGNLSTVTYPVSAQTTTACPGTTASGTSTYTYDQDQAFIHLYTGGTDGRGCPLPTSTYYPSGSADANGNSLAGRLQSVTDAYSEKTSYAYDLPTYTTTITYPADGSGNVGTATMIYDSFGDLLQSTDPNNLTTTNVYDANHNLAVVSDPLGHATTYTYDSNGNKTSSTYQATPTSHNTTSSTYYNQYSEPTSTIDELGNVRFFNYDTNYLPQSVTDSIGTLASFVFNSNATLASGAIGFDISVNPAQASQFAYDAYGNMTSRTDALGRTTSYVYNSLGQKTSMTTPTPTSLTGSSASTTSYVYDAMGNLTSTAAPLSRSTSSTFDANGNKLSDTDARNNTTYYIYDAMNRLVETDYPTTPATKSTKTYDFRNNVLTETDQAGNVTQHVYDPGGRQTSVTRGSGATASTTSYTYRDDGRKATETDPANNVTNYYYDAAGRLISVTGAQGTTTYGYDDAGNRTSGKDGNNNTTSFQYDARKRLIETDYPDGKSVKNTYDGPGNLASVIDQAGNEVDYTYDAANQLKTVVQVNSPNAPSNTNNYAYDPLGSLTSVEDARNNTTQNLFDLYGEPLQKTLPITTFTESRTYDPAGNLSTLTHFNNAVTTYAYDALNRLLSRSTPGEPSDSVSFTYTATGKYLTSTGQDGTVNYGYDSLDRLITKATPEGTLSYTYYPTGKVETIVSSNPNGVSAAYTYDAQNRLSTVVDARLPGANTTTYTYDSASNLATAQYPNGLTSTFTYDSLNRLTELSTPPVADYKYTLGLTGIRTNATEQSGRTLQWSYDNIYRLTGETITGDPSNNGNDNGNATYGLDPVGNRTTEASSLSGINPIAGTYNANDQLTSSETYDANGNTTHTANGNSYTYDSENHMITMTNGATVVNLIYDAFGNRVAKTVNGVTTQYLVEDDVNPTGYPQVVEELVNGVVTRQYTYGLQRISENLSPALSGNSTWTPSFYGYDGFGSVRQLTNSSGVVTDSYEYDAFGNSFTKQGATPNNYLYRGELFDADLGLYYLRHRYMNPLTGRFMSRDPKEYKPLGPDQQLYDAEVQPIDPRKLHTYLYASADPVNRIDPKGLEDEVEDAMDNLESISKFQNKVRKGQITNRIIDCIQKSFDEVDHVLEDIVRGKIDPGDY